jgi:tetratricopeptide (TPR) repeat protein
MRAFRSGRWGEAVAAFGRVKSPNAGVLYCAGQAYLRMGRREAAIKSFRQALVRDPDYTPARRALDALLPSP